jgi:hypothetical protein
MSSAEPWETLKKELRQHADREIAATTHQNRRNSIRSDLTSFVRLPLPTSDYEMDQRRSLAAEYRSAWGNAAQDGRVQDALFGRLNKSDDPKDS